MDKIKRELQHATWEYDFTKNELTLSLKDSQNTRITFNKTYSYSLGRFLIRVWQKLAQQKRKIKPSPAQQVKQAVNSVIKEVKNNGKTI